MDKQEYLEYTTFGLSPELASVLLPIRTSFSLEETEYEWPEELNKTILGTQGNYALSRVRNRTFTKLPSEIIIRLQSREYRPSQTTYREMQYWLNEICEGNVNCNMKALTRQDTFSSIFGRWRNDSGLTTRFYPSLHRLYYSDSQKRQLQDRTGTATFRVSFPPDHEHFIQEPSFNETGLSFGRVKLLPGAEITFAADFSRNTIRGNIIFNQGVGRINLQETTMGLKAYIGHANGIIYGENYSGNYYGYYTGGAGVGTGAVAGGLFLTNDSKTRYLESSYTARETE